MSGRYIPMPIVQPRGASLMGFIKLQNYHLMKSRTPCASAEESLVSISGQPCGVPGNWVWKYFRRGWMAQIVIQ